MDVKCWRFRVVGEETLLLATSMLFCYSDFFSVHELLPLVPVELLQSDSQFGLRVPAVRSGLPVHGGSFSSILADSGDRGGGAASDADRVEQGHDGARLPQGSTHWHNDRATASTGTYS